VLVQRRIEDRDGLLERRRASEIDESALDRRHRHLADQDDLVRIEGAVWTWRRPVRSAPDRFARVTCTRLSGTFQTGSP
jgi:hypothetical protein